MTVSYLREPSQELVASICDRRLGIGADGLMIIAPSDVADFKMIYYNSDGRQSTMCGNGGRAIAHLARNLKLIKAETTFEAIDGLHEAKIIEGQVELKMIDVLNIEQTNEAFVLDTGSPHFVQFREATANIDIISEAQKIRYNDRFEEVGVNVNFIEQLKSELLVRTYERGVEDETYSCGTGVTAAGIASLLNNGAKDGEHTVRITTKGGNLSVKVKKQGNSFTDVWLIGPAQKVYEGQIEIQPS
ncbi:UNVERIFIED_CONTAM: hypothetical protein GTU68_039648 [Idotea baltica]|nr:hypothetical protein [Idotea baltica]